MVRWPARSIACINSRRLCAFEIPTLEPRFAGFTKQGYESFFSMSESSFLECSLYSLIMVQATTQGKGIPGLLEHIYQSMDYYNELPALIV